MSKPFFMVFFAFVVGYTGYVFLTSSPLERMNRACAPFTLWPGTLVTAAVKIGSRDQAAETSAAFDTGFNTCRRWLWNAFYEDDYRRLQDERKAQK